MATETKQSPRSENGIIKWYEGDIFFLDFAVNDYFTKQPIELGENDRLSIEFHTCQRLIKIFDKMDKTEEGLFRIHIDKDITRLFKAGRYHYDIRYHKNNDETRQTIYDGCSKRKKSIFKS